MSKSTTAFQLIQLSQKIHLQVSPTGPHLQSNLGLEKTVAQTLQRTLRHQAPPYLSTLELARPNVTPLHRYKEHRKRLVGISPNHSL